MLHEVLLSLSGHPSPLWQTIEPEYQKDGSDSTAYAITPAEKSMLQSLAKLARLHIQIRDLARKVSATHDSRICQGVAASIGSKHLADFRRKVLDVERLVLSKDAGYVGGYGITPLSTIVGELAPWTRRLEWLWKTTQFMSSEPAQRPLSSQSRSQRGSDIMNYLQAEMYTGYADLEEIVRSLLIVAETVWMQQLASWLLYGRILGYCKQDFFVQPVSDAKADDTQYTVAWDLAPNVISQVAANAALSIGVSLNHVQHHEKYHSSRPSSLPSPNSLIADHLKQLKTLRYPLSQGALELVILSIRTSISQNNLSRLLPASEILEILRVLQYFLLLQQGEFALCLIGQAKKHIEQQGKPPPQVLLKKAGGSPELHVSKRDAAAIVSRTWSEMPELQSDESGSAIAEKAKELLQLQFLQSQSGLTFISTLLPAPSVLKLALPKHSTLSLFLSAEDLNSYASISSYLLSIRRAEIQLNGLWNSTALRRCHPSPLAPPRSSTSAGRRILETRRAREEARSVRIRKHRAMCNKALFVLGELYAYLQGEVISRHFGEYRRWLGEATRSYPTSSEDVVKQSQNTDSNEPETTSPALVTDPNLLAEAHRACLRSMRSALLLDESAYTSTLRDLLPLVDHFVALFGRLVVTWQALDLQEDEGVVDTLTNYKKDEGEVLWEMDRSGTLLDERIAALVEQINLQGSTERMAAIEIDISENNGVGGERNTFVPFKGRLIDRLIMKLEYLTGGGSRTTRDDGIEDEDD